jgi:hypothetical protein
MSFGITVHRLSDDELFKTHPADVYSEEFDHWIKDCQERLLYENPLGADGTVFELWNVPAHEIGLPLVGAIYNDGLRVAGEDLDRLSRELDALERFWDDADFSQAGSMNQHIIHADGSQESRAIPLRDDLQERLGYLREAIRIAAENDGIVEIC